MPRLPLNFKNPRLLNFILAVAECQLDPAVRLSDVTGLEPLDLSLSTAVAKKYGFIVSVGQFGLIVTPAGSTWALGQIEGVSALLEVHANHPARAAGDVQ